MDNQQLILSVSGLGFQIDGVELLRQIDLQIPKGSFVGIIGPNGCGKSTLLKNIYRAYKPNAGCIYLDCRDIRKMSGREIARKMAVVAQENETRFDFSVMEIMEMSRFAHHGPFRSCTPEDRLICEKALASVGMENFQNRSFLSLSGGEKQRVLIAGAFSRGADLILLDEPTNHLDIGYQFLIMDLMKQQKQITVLSSVHDLNMAMEYCDLVLALKQGSVLEFGTPDEIITPSLLNELFHVRAEILSDGDNRRFIRYLGSTMGLPHQ